jgi:hypothetical protein
VPNPSHGLTAVMGCTAMTSLVAEVVHGPPSWLAKPWKRRPWRCRAGTLRKRFRMMEAVLVAATQRVCRKGIGVAEKSATPGEIPSVSYRNGGKRKRIA